jgi:hypothetical protein
MSDDTDDYYGKQAAYAHDYAKMAIDDFERAEWLNIAQRWLALIDDRKATERLKDALHTDISLRDTKRPTR